MSDVSSSTGSDIGCYAKCPPCRSKSTECKEERIPAAVRGVRCVTMIHPDRVCGFRLNWSNSLNLWLLQKITCEKSKYIYSDSNIYSRFDGLIFIDKRRAHFVVARIIQRRIFATEDPHSRSADVEVSALQNIRKLSGGTRKDALTTTQLILLLNVVTELWQEMDPLTTTAPMQNDCETE